VSCAKVRGIVNDLEKEHGENLTFSQFDAKTPESVKMIEASGLKLHGALGKNGAGEIIWKAQGHQMSREMLKEGVAVVMKGTNEK
jgi:hypothetical protein